MPKVCTDPYARFPEDRELLAAELVSIIQHKKIDFTPSESNAIINDDTARQIYRNGKYYRLWTNIFKNKFVELKVTVHSTHPDRPKYTDYTVETCFVYYNWDTKGYAPDTFTKIGKYVIEDYFKHSFLAIDCFFCECLRIRSSYMKNHVKTKKHENNKKKVISELSNILNLPYDITVLITEKLPYK
jgi:hypothetical protein